jgi:hypothetical protein
MVNKSTDDQFDKSCQRRHKKKIMKEFVIKEISAVDYGAQEPAKAVLMKRDDRPEPMEKLITITSETEGHQHALYIDSYDLEQGGGTTRYALGTSSDGEEAEEHNHPYVIEDDGTITVGMTAGHTHEVDSMLIRRLTMPVRQQSSVHESVDVVKTESPRVKFESGKDFNADDFAYVEDPNNPQTWKYRLVGSPGGNPCRRQVGNAVEALKRGEIPEAQQMSVIRRVRTAWLKAYRSGSTKMPAVLKRVSLS